jgi:hypothetical protein
MKEWKHIRTITAPSGTKRDIQLVPGDHRLPPCEADNDRHQDDVTILHFKSLPHM